MWSTGIAFTPLADVLPAEEEGRLRQALTALSRPLNRFTLTTGGVGWGIGWHFHNEALFLLASGRKKWCALDRPCMCDAHAHIHVI